MECPSCYENFNTKEQTPRNLLCGHTFCEKCLLMMEKAGAFSCPICRKMHAPYRAAELPKNYIALELVQKEIDSKISTEMCADHPNEQLKLYCATCSALICSECVIDHSGHKFLKKSESSYLFRTNIENLITIIAESIEEADNHILEFEAAQKQLSEYAGRQNTLFNQVLEKIISLVKVASEKAKTDFQLAIEGEEKKIEEDLFKYVATKKELQEASVELGNIMDALAAEDKLSKEKEQNQMLETMKAKVQQLSNKCMRYRNPVVHPPSYDFHIDKLNSVIKDSFKILINGEEYGVSKKICYFGEKTKVLKFNLESEGWEQADIVGPYEIQYYSAAISTHEGNALIVGGGVSQDVFLYIEKENKLISMAKIKEPRKEHALVRLGTDIYVLGGYNGKNKTFLSSCEKFILKENKWVSCASLKTQRCAFAATSVNGDKIIACGGFDGKKRLDSIEEYDQEGDVWTLLPYKLPLPLSNLAVFNPYRDRIVILGGGLSTGFYTSVEILNLSSGEWGQLAPLRDGKDFRNKVIFSNNAAYGFGGNNYASEKLLIENNKWVDLKPYPIQNNLDSWACSLTFQLPVTPK